MTRAPTKAQVHCVFPVQQQQQVLLQHEQLMIGLPEPCVFRLDVAEPVLILTEKNIRHRNIARRFVEVPPLDAERSDFVDCQTIW
jgi:hypothetical protein